MKIIYFLFASLLYIGVSFFPGAIAQTKKVHTASRIINGLSPTIDGELNEDIWNSQGTNWSSDFVQRSPRENASPTQPTSFAIKFDAKHLYIGIICFDSMAHQINHRMSRRDGYNGDWIEVILDSYHDLRSAFSLSVSAAGVKSDKSIALNGELEDLAWNPIWYAKTSVKEDRWTAEMKIPLSQLRFSKSSNQVWGLQVQRRILRNEELSVWQRVPQNAAGWVSEFGELHGINHIKGQRQFEIQPFTVGSIHTFEKDLFNPFKKNDQYNLKFGVDGKIGITNDLTLDFTINPDFGQVEADPATIVLDGFQPFFEEQRPFFTANSNIFSYRFSSPKIGSPYSSDNLFYSRRVGRAPQGNPSLNSGEYSQSPLQTTILSAIKFSGKTKNGWSVGLLESLTSAEYSEISDGTSFRQTLIEPQTNYFVGRLQKDLNQRNTFIGGIFTSVLRENQASTEFLHSSAHTGGVDILHQWDDRTWYAGLNVVMSHVNGSPVAITQTQQSIPHLFQRQGANHVNLDSTKTSLTGTGGDLKIGKAGNGHVRFESGLTWRSPELEINDVGFMREADIIQHYFGITYQSINAFGAFRNASIGYKHWFNWDFAGNLNYIDWDIEWNGTFRNNWSSTFGLFSQPHIYGKSLLQGGPRIRLSNQYGAWWALSSDSRKKIYIAYNGWTKTGGKGSYYLLENGFTLTYQPIDKFNLSLSPRFTRVRHRLQYTDTHQFQDNDVHIVSMLDQNTLSLAFRANIIINANLAIQYYAQPYISQGFYEDFGLVDQPSNSFDKDQIAFFEPHRITQDNDDPTYRIDLNSDNTTDIILQDPNFSLAQFRSNLVLRYEYRPGSEFYLVWAQGVNKNGAPSTSLIDDLQDQILRASMDNTFLVKLTHRFHR